LKTVEAYPITIFKKNLAEDIINQKRVVSYQFSDGSIYEGEWILGEPHGEGILNI